MIFFSFQNYKWFLLSSVGLSYTKIIVHRYGIRTLACNWYLCQIKLYIYNYYVLLRTTVYLLLMTLLIIFVLRIAAHDNLFIVNDVTHYICVCV